MKIYISKPVFITFLFFFFQNNVSGQENKKVTLEDIWLNDTFREKSVHSVNWMRNGQYYSSLETDYDLGISNIVKYDITTGEKVETIVKGDELVPKGENYAIIFDSYQFSTDESMILFATETEPIYRRSTKANYYVLHLKKPVILSRGGKQSYATFSPDGSKVAFVRDNNLFYVDLDKMSENQITTTGEWNKIIVGSADWVYEEEFAFAKAFFWSPDSKKIAYYTFDESRVKEYNMQLWGELYPADYKFKYPKAGEDNSIVTISVYDVENDKTARMNIGNEKDIYIPRIKWTHDPNTLSIFRMNRLQNVLEILHANAKTGKTTLILKETSSTYISINDDLTYLKKRNAFVYTSEKDGFKHLYLFDFSNKKEKQITKGNWEVDEFIGIDENTNLSAEASAQAGTLYFTSTEDSPLQRQFYSIGIDNNSTTRPENSGFMLSTGTTKKGTNRIDMSPDFKYYLDYHSSADQPTIVSLHNTQDGALIKVLEDNKALSGTLSKYDISPKDFFQLTTTDGVKLNGWMIKPIDFDKKKKYPVLMYVYGGPGSQTVTDSWSSRNYYWYQLLAQKGYIIVSVDNRGTGARGTKFKNITYGRLGEYETKDQIEAAKYLASLPYVDGSRIGIWGWSYGGYMTSLCLTLGSDYFKAGIAVAPVTSWRFYDTIYTERYLKKPQDNPKGYDDYSPITHADKLKGAYLLIHGTGDDNVHFQNTVEMQEALIKAGKQFTSFYYPNKAHAIYGGKTRLHLFQMMTDFIVENL